MLKFSGSSNIKNFVKKYIEENGAFLSGKVVVDIPAGLGETSSLIKEQGGDIKPYDLFPEFFNVENIACNKADLGETLPIESKSVDVLFCQEGLEHLPNQLFALKEFSRVLRDNGKLLITVPNISHLRAKLSYFFTESELYSRMPANELDALWYSDEGRMYFGHIFLINIQKLRVLAVAAGFRIKKIHTVKASSTSLLLGIFYPLIVLINLYSYISNMLKKDKLDKEQKKKVYGEIFKLNIHPSIQFGRHLFLEFEKSDAELSVHNSRR